MKTGILNDQVSYSVTFEDRTVVPATLSGGNPFAGEPLTMKWGDIRDSGVEIRMELAEACFVDAVTVTLGEKTRLTSLVLKWERGILSAHTAETGGSIRTNPVELEAGVQTKELRLVLTGNFSDVEVQSIRLFGSYPEKAELFPTPEDAVYGDERVPAAQFASYSADSPEGLQAGKILAEKFREETGISMEGREEGAVQFRYDPAVCTNGYALEVTADKAEIRAADLRGFVCGAESFLKLTEAGGMRTCRISDKPFMPFRGVHLYLPSKENMAFTKRLVKYLISPMGYNLIIMEVGAGMRFDSHPEINDRTVEAIQKGKQHIWPLFNHSEVASGTIVEKQDVRDLVSYIRSFGIEIIPEVQSLGHVPYLTHTYPEIAEIPENQEGRNIDTRVEDARPSDFYPHCYCPSNPRSYEILFDVLDEIIQVFQPREYVHMGHDEVYQIGVCPVCKKTNPAELFARDVNKIYNHLKEKGLKMMIWADMLQPVTKYLTPSAIHKIPKDIVLLDFIWYFHMTKDIEDNLLAENFSVVMGNLYSSHYPRFETRIRKNGIVGGQISAWTETSERGLQQEGKLYDFLYTAQMLWSASYSREHRLSYERLLGARMPALREKLQDVKYPSRMPGARGKVLLENLISFPPKGMPAQKREVIAKGAYKSLVFTHTMLRRITRMPWTENEPIGSYVLTYSDGTEERVPLNISGNIGYWNRRHDQPLTHRLYRHTGYICCYYTDGEEWKTPEGENVTLYRYEYILPEGKQLSRIRLEEDPEKDAGIFVRWIEGIY